MKTRGLGTTLRKVGRKATHTTRGNDSSEHVKRVQPKNRRKANTWQKNDKTSGQTWYRLKNIPLNSTKGTRKLTPTRIDKTKSNNMERVWGCRAVDVTTHCQQVWNTQSHHHVKLEVHSPNNSGGKVRVPPTVQTTRSGTDCSSSSKNGTEPLSFQMQRRS